MRRTLRLDPRADSARRLVGLLGALLIVVSVAVAIISNKVADVLPDLGPAVLVSLFVLGVLLWVGVAGWIKWLTRRAAEANIVLGVDPRNLPWLCERAQARAEQQVRQALHHVVTLELGVETRSDIIEFPDDLLLRRVDDDAARPVPAGQSKLAAFEQLDQTMLVLGDPGAGKTVWLNQLAIELAMRARTEPDQPIPVVLDLLSWTAHRRPLDEWLVEALHVAYGVRPALGKRLVRANSLLPLLDGLDEVPKPDRAACVAAINSYQQTRAHPDGRLRPLVVCSRSAEAEALAARLTRLRLTGAVTLQPPSYEKVTAYLAAVGASEVLGILPAHPDDDPELWALLRSPLSLSIIALARTRAVAALHQPADQRLDALLDAYVNTLLTPSDGGGRLRAVLAAWPPGRTRGWLAWLAASMTCSAMTELYLERLQPTWLATRHARRIVRWAPGLVGLVGGLCWALLIGLRDVISIEMTVVGLLGGLVVQP
jgi:NACHT domain